MEQQALVFALIGILGIGAQWIAWRTGWPAIALMLLSGALVVACVLMARLGPYTYRPASRPAPMRGGAAPEADKQPSLAT